MIWGIITATARNLVGWITF